MRFSNYVTILIKGLGVLGLLVFFSTSVFATLDEQSDATLDSCILKMQQWHLSKSPTDSLQAFECLKNFGSGKSSSLVVEIKTAGKPYIKEITTLSCETGNPIEDQKCSCADIKHPIKSNSDIRMVVKYLDKTTTPLESLRLSLDGVMLPTIAPISYTYSLEDTTTTLIFRMKRDSLAYWEMLYRRPITSIYQSNPAQVSLVTIEGKIITSPKSIFVKATSMAQIILGCGLILITLGLFLYYSHKTEFLRVTLPKMDKLPPIQTIPFSLSRSQLAWWTLIVSVSFCYVWIFTGELTAMTSSTLLLLGISGGTSFFATLINKKEITKINDAPAGDLAVAPASDPAIDAAGAGVAEPTDKPLTSEHKPATFYPSKGFLKDILKDEKENGISVPRFQFVLFTIIISGYFVYYVYQHLSMPEIDPNLLTLMGISSIGYAGFKTTENK